MSQNTFLKGCSLESKDVLKDIYNKAFLSDKTGKSIYTEKFYTPNILNYINKLDKYFDIAIVTYGIFKEGERKIVCFNLKDLDEVPIVLMKIRYNSKFQTLKHKDFLGALMSLGIKREKMGDVLLKEDICYVPVFRELYDYIKLNLTHIAKTPCIIEKVDLKTQVIPEFNFKKILIRVSSNRIDSIVSSLCNVSRSKALQFISQGKVLLNYNQTLKKDKDVTKHSVIVIRGYGKFKMVEKVGFTSKGKLKILFKKFI